MGDRLDLSKLPRREDGPVRVDYWQSPRSGEFYWHAVGDNGGVIADGGEGFRSVGSLMHNIELNYGHEVVVQQVEPPGPSD